ncbi:hypothetical protein L861_23940 [Litchfieldella anticariensis FP35 = DSM 16096]|uniref:ABC transporter substrate-binding protein n=1 Tax=Litchfieldella anticariensis (strain DSM 16096 / CECT 5854 / CIP 108499 / LMG 22089 / FP35) TaxID=1121939 RepID=S2LDM1_LITA3|nr:DUF1007 family protein [Halomonas anticariensis]EPC02866.1 hypothetical protein L861_23940 [Halomonas anticariensis FP35 = DSM 16096]
MGSIRFLPRRLVIAVIVVLSLGWCGVANAHPHGWIDLGVRVILDDQGRVEALHQRWLMDPFYSLVVLEELGRAEGDASMEARLDQLGMEIRDNVAAQHYFTELTHDGHTVALGEVKEYTVMQRGSRVEFSFVLPLETPLALEGKAMQYQVFDPSYYIEIVHEAEDDETPREDALVVVGADIACTTRIEPADPDPAKVTEAAMLDYDDQAEPGLGRFFAETGEVSCHG